MLHNDFCDISTCHATVRSLSQSKLRCIWSDLASDFEFDIITLLETFLNVSIPDDDLNVKGFYKIIRRDRLHGVGSGVALYLSSALYICRRFAVEIPDLELLWSEVRVYNNKFFKS